MECVTIFIATRWNIAVVVVAADISINVCTIRSDIATRNGKRRKERKKP